MYYISTRDEKLKKQKFTEVVIKGLAEDGGLYLPMKFPNFSIRELKLCKKMNYIELALFIFKKFEVNIEDKDLKNILVKTYNKNIFKHSRNKNNRDISPVIKLEEKLFLLELSNGPTFAFKDIAMQFLGNLFQYLFKDNNQKINILGATSGDTGSAAEYAFLNKDNINVFMLSPYGKMSEFQRAQMFNLLDKNIYNLSIYGLFDDAQAVIKEVFNDKKFKKDFKITAINSINWGRILSQTVYYFKAYLNICNEVGEKIDFVVPTGNFGNIYAGYVARKCGLPIDKLILVTNENDVLNEFFKTGIYKPRSSKETFITSSPSMDISKASNFERFLFDILDNSPKALNEKIIELKKQGYIDLSDDLNLRKIKEQNILSYSSKEKDRFHSILKIYKKFKLLIDPHTADAFSYILNNKLQNKTVVLETAQAIKFSETIKKVLNIDLDLGENLKLNSIQKFFTLKPDSEIIKKFIKDNN